MDTHKQVIYKYQQIPSDFLETRRLAFRSWELEDLPALTTIYTNPNVMRFMGGVKTLVDIEKELKKMIDHFENYNFGPFAVLEKKTHRVIGCSGLFFSKRTQYPEFGIVLDQAYWGKHLFIEIFGNIVQWGFKKFDPKQIDIFVELKNCSVRSKFHRLKEVRCIDEDFNYHQKKYAHYVISNLTKVSDVSIHSSLDRLSLASFETRSPSSLK